jgi:acylphosphatase
LTIRHLIIRGRVQGVWYRESMRQEAERLGVAGWVRNRRDGSVEAMIQGSDAALDALIQWARVGPPAARVESLEVGEASGDSSSGEFSGFAKRPTT